MDDGFEDLTADGKDRREEIVNCELLILGWQLRSRGGDREAARLWALVQTETGDVRKVKFYDAGMGNLQHAGISTTLRDMEDNGTVGDVRAKFCREVYPFFDREGTEQTGVRYWIEDVNPDDESARVNAADDTPDF